MSMHDLSLCSLVSDSRLPDADHTLQAKSSPVIHLVVQICATICYSSVFACTLQRVKSLSAAVMSLTNMSKPSLSGHVWMCRGGTG